MRVFNSGDNDIIDEKIENRGRPTECKYCGEKFKILPENKDSWTNNNTPCPKCGVDYCVLPPTEKELRELQNLYLDTKKEKYFNSLILILYSYTESLIKKKFSNRLTFEDSLTYYTHNTVSLFVEEYLKNPDFKIDYSFAGLLIMKIKQAIFQKQEHATAQESLDYILDDGNTVERADHNKSTIELIEDDEDKRILYNKIIDLIFGMEQYSKYSFDSYYTFKREDWLRIIAINNYILDGDKYYDLLFKAYNNSGKYITMQTLEFLKKEMKKELIDSIDVRETEPVKESTSQEDRTRNSIYMEWVSWKNKFKLNKNMLRKEWFKYIDFKSLSSDLKNYCAELVDKEMKSHEVLIW